MSDGKKRGRREAERAKLQWPWSNRGWSTDEYRSQRDADLDRKVEEAGPVLPYGYYEDRPGLAISPLMHNPYLNLVFGPVFVWLGLFVLDKLHEVLGLAIGLAIFFGLVGAVVLIVSAVRIPGWHRARRLARDHIAEHGGNYPPELRWYR